MSDTASSELVRRLRDEADREGFMGSYPSTVVCPLMREAAQHIETLTRENYLLRNEHSNLKDFIEATGDLFSQLTEETMRLRNNGHEFAADELESVLPSLRRAYEEDRSGGQIPD